MYLILLFELNNAPNDLKFSTIKPKGCTLKVAFLFFNFIAKVYTSGRLKSKLTPTGLSRELGTALYRSIELGIEYKGL